MATKSTTYWCHARLGLLAALSNLCLKYSPPGPYATTWPRRILHSLSKKPKVCARVQIWPNGIVEGRGNISHQTDTVCTDLISSEYISGMGRWSLLHVTPMRCGKSYKIITRRGKGSLVIFPKSVFKPAITGYEYASMHVLGTQLWHIFICFIGLTLLIILYIRWMIW